MTYIIEILSILLGMLYVYMGVFKYGLWKGITISAGFLPALCGGALAITAALMLIQKLKNRGDQKEEKIDPKALIPVGAMLAILVLNHLVGLLGACLVMSFLWLRFIEKYSWKTSIITSVLIFAFAYLIFRLWLTVPFPMGLLENIL